MTDLALLTIAGPVATLTLNRPEQRNALSLDLLTALHARADELANRPDIHVLVVTGAGRAFCAGMDLKQVLGDAELSSRLLRDLATFTHKLRALPMVTLAHVNGPAIGGGCGLVTVCDLAIGSSDTKMGFPEVDLGVCPAVVAPWLVRKIGPGRARKVLLMGGLMSGHEAHELGILTRCVGTSAELGAAVDETVKHLCAGGPVALRATKALLNELDSSTDLDVLLRAAQLSADVLNTPATQATLRAKMGA